MNDNLCNLNYVYNKTTNIFLNNRNTQTTVTLHR